MTTYVEGMNLSQVQAAIIAGEYPNKWAYALNELTLKGLPVSEFASQVEYVTDGYVKATIGKSGNVIGYTVAGTPQATVENLAVNSNTTSLARATINAPVSTVTEAGSTAVKTSRLAGVGTKVATAAGRLAIPLTLASIGITLGKTIDEVAYSVNPDFWDSIGASTVNPQTWSTIAGENEFGQDFINAIFGIDPQTGETQAYIDSEAMSYLAYCMYLSNIFATGEVYDEVTSSARSYTHPLIWYSGTASYQEIPTIWSSTTKGIIGSPIPANDGTYYIPKFTFNNETTSDTLSYKYFVAPDGIYQYIYFVFTDSRCNGLSVSHVNASGKIDGGLGSSNVTSYTYDNKTVRSGYLGINSQYNPFVAVNLTGEFSAADTTTKNNNCWSVLYGTSTHHESTPVAGFGNQENATLPNTSNWDDYANVLPSLQQTYPDMFTNAINYPVVQPDGTIQNKVYVPITLPDTNSITGTQPVSGGQTQANPSVDPSTANQNLTDLLTNLLQQPFTQPISDTPTPPSNPTDTGEGNTPQVTAPTGSASSLWAIYHPSQSEIDSFGAWLWSSNFIDQILKIFNNPMEAIIGLHKIYATPVDAGTTTIKVGYLDSNVSSAYITQQYVEVNCGTVNLYEQYGNVFDYSPYTDVHLYLPFVGIVPLNVADVMRSSINVTYGVDVITGACLAMVTVSRDANDAILYQYSGNCAVQYPVSSGSYMGIVSSIIGVAGGIAATAATGGGAAPIVMGAAGAAFNAHTSVQRSGSFSGNSGAMGGKIPYLIISRPQTKLADNFDVMQGYPTNAYTTVGECSGYIKAIAAHVINVNATDDELTLINDYLLSGIII